MPFLTDTHCHLNLSQFKSDIDQVIQKAIEIGIERILVPGIDIASSKKAVELSQRYKGLVFASVGIHPNTNVSFNNHALDAIAELAKCDSVVAIGEIGLDFYRNINSHEVQKNVLESQLNLALDNNLPIIIHNRKSEDILMPILASWISKFKENNKSSKYPGILHSYVGSNSMTKEFLKMNFFISVSGPITYTNNINYCEFVKTLPLDHLLVETDSPYLPPHPLRGQRNEPANILYIVNKLKTIFNIDIEEFSKITFKNSKAVFGW